MSTSSLLQPGFAQPVQESQQVFRHALSALSEPGTIQHLEHAPGMDRLSPATYALCLCLLDGDTPVWLSPRIDTPALRENLAFHCGCPITEHPEQAAFAVMTGVEATEVPAFNPGTDRDPDLSCTVLVQLDALEGGPAAAWHGPGIQDRRGMRLPVPPGFWPQRALHAFPRGLDFFFAADDTFVGLPRSTHVLSLLQEEN